MEGINKKYNIKLEILTPLSIGAGAEKDWVRGVDFVVDKGILYKLNLKKMVANGINPDELTSFFATKNESGLKAKLAGKLNAVSDFTMQFPAESDYDVKTFVKNQLSGNPLLTGSSLKGALRSVIFDYLGANSKDGKEVFGSSVKGDEFMRFIKIADAEFSNTELVNTKVFNLQKKGEWIGGWKLEQTQTNSKFSPTGFNTLYECLMPGQKSWSTMMQTEKLFNLFGQEYYEKVIKSLDLKSKNPNNKNRNDKIEEDIKANNILLKAVDDKRNLLNINLLFSIINNHSRKYLTKEKKFFEKYNTDKTDKIIESINKLLNMIPSDNSYCIMKMSAGSGFHSITGDWQFKDYSINGLDTTKKVSRGLFNDKKSAKSRKIVIYNGLFSLMGFVKLRAISDEDLKAEIKKQESERLAKIEETKRQAEAALQAEKIQKEKEEKYKSLVEKAKELYGNNDIENALTVCVEAAELCPDFTLHKSIKELIDLKIKQIETDKQTKVAEQQAQAELEKRKADRIAAGLSFLLEKKVGIDELKITELSNGVGRINQFLKKNIDYVITDNDKTAVRDWLKLLPKPTKKADKREYEDFGSKSWNGIKTLFGETFAKQIFEGLN